MLALMCTRLHIMSVRHSCFPPCALSLQANLANITHVLLPYCQKLASHFLFPSPSHFPENHSCGAAAINIINVEGKTETEEGGTGVQSMFLRVGENTGRKRLLLGSRANLGQNFLGPGLSSEAPTCLLNGLQQKWIGYSIGQTLVRKLSLVQRYYTANVWGYQVWGNVSVIIT